LAPAIALGLFAVMFTVSTLWIGPAIRGDNDDSEPADHEEHHTVSFGTSHPELMRTPVKAR
jgi:hypothetical protein